VFEEILQKGVDSGLFRKLEVRSVISALSDFLYGTVVCYCLSDRDEGSIEEIINTGLELFINGIKRVES